ncbi:nucleoside deaminase [Neobacillus sp. SAB-20_R2A]|uniref:nucleoside deaminase n=1 Tax=Neobacillus sp. SAB-20_R2A TaxID=3120519 RepID=UPI003C6E951E
MDKFMKRAVELALQNVAEGGQPFGAVLVKNNTIVSEGVNELHKKFDISGHAELLAIRRAQEQFQTNDLSGCVVYASGEPCAMCLAAMYFAGVEKVYYCASVEDAAEVGFGKIKIHLRGFEKVSIRKVLAIYPNAFRRRTRKSNGALEKTVLKK